MKTREINEKYRKIKGYTYKMIHILAFNCSIEENLVPYNIVSEYDQEIPQSQTADKPMAPRGRAT